MLPRCDNAKADFATVHTAVEIFINAGRAQDKAEPENAGGSSNFNLNGVDIDRVSGVIIEDLLGPRIGSASHIARLEKAPHGDPRSLQNPPVGIRGACSINASREAGSGLLQRSEGDPMPRTIRCARQNANCWRATCRTLSSTS
jgi:hypothetical protein